MSVYISGMEMPRYCGECPFFSLESAGNGMYWDYCKAKRFPVGDADNAVDGDCPLVPVPDHGRLVDADALCEGLVSNHPVVIHAKCAPTIIPADHEEGVGK